jgi:hypothetical protein
VCELSAVGDWMTDSKVLYVDAVTNIDLGSVGGKSDILACLATLTTNYRKDISPKRPIHAPVQTVLFTQSAKGRGRNAQRHYDKFAELKENKLFLKTLSDKSKLLSCCVNLVRVESTEHTFKGMRQNYGIADNTLSNMLHSAKNVNYERFVRIQGTSVQRELFELFDSVDAAVEAGMKRYDYEKLMGRYSIAKMANYDTEVIRQYLIKFGDSNVRRTLKEYIRMIDDMKRNGMLLGTAKGHEAILRRYTDMLAAA